MTDINKERLLSKLELWNTPGFFHFLKDLENFLDEENEFNLDLILSSNLIKHRYIDELKGIVLEEEKKSKFKQGKLDI